MDWTKDKKGNATSDDKPEDDFFAEAKKKILEQIADRLARDRSFHLCSITGNPKVGKTGLVLDCRTEEETSR